MAELKGRRERGGWVGGRGMVVDGDGDVEREDDDTWVKELDNGSGESAFPFVRFRLIGSKVCCWLWRNARAGYVFDVIIMAYFPPFPGNLFLDG
ncbi:hypothetical protein V6N13_067057 [Hibiscus sabdariffa]